VVLITECASRVGFKGGLVVDYPNSSKAKKYYLCLSFETAYRIPQALGSRALGEMVAVTERERIKKGKSRGESTRPAVKSRDWIMQKKEKQRKLGHTVRPDTKYSGRKRKDKM